MFNDKKLRNTFWLAVLAAISPALYWAIVIALSPLPSIYLQVEIGLAGLAGLISLYALIVFIRKWRIWKKPAIKIIGKIISLAGFLGGLFLIGIALLSIALSRAC